jgi:hypothetical protein
LDVCTPQGKAKLDVLFGRTIYSTATPFHIVENHYWIEFFRHLRPAYKLPSRHCISNPLLNKEYELMQEEVNIKMQAADALTLVSDGWTDNTGNSIINVLFCIPKLLLQNSLRKTLRARKIMHRFSKTLTVTFIYVKQLNKTTFSLWLLSVRI